MKSDDTLLKECWQQLVDEKIHSDKLNKQDIMEAIKKESNYVMASISKRLKAKLNWIIFFIVVFSLWMVFAFKNTELFLILAGFNAIYVISFFLLWVPYRKMTHHIELDGNILSTLKHNYKHLTDALKLERLFGIATFPIAIIVGALISRNLNGYSIQETFQNERILMVMIIGMVVLVPLMYFMSEKMNKSAFGELKAKMEKNINQLELVE